MPLLFLCVDVELQAVHASTLTSTQPRSASASLAETGAQQEAVKSERAAWLLQIAAASQLYSSEGGFFGKLTRMGNILVLRKALARLAQERPEIERRAVSSHSSLDS